MKSISRAQKLDRRTHGDGALLGALDHRRADHEFVVRARHDVEGNARMQKAHRARRASPRACGCASFRHARRAIQEAPCEPPNRGSRRRRPRPPQALRHPRRSGSRRLLRASALSAPTRRRADRDGLRPRRTGLCGSARQDPAQAPRCALRPRAHATTCARRSDRSRLRRAAARQPACPRASRREHARSHQSIAPWPSSTTVCGALSPSQNGASMPPASHDALPPSSRERSMSVTFAPRSASAEAVVRPTTPAPMTVARMARLYSAAST